MTPPGPEGSFAKDTNICIEISRDLTKNSLETLTVRAEVCGPGGTAARALYDAPRRCTGGLRGKKGEGGGGQPFSNGGNNTLST